jgi:hypothetical protein
MAKKKVQEDAGLEDLLGEIMAAETVEEVDALVAESRAPVEDDFGGLIVVDEAGPVTEEMFAAIKAVPMPAAKVVQASVTYHGPLNEVGKPNNMPRKGDRRGPPNAVPKAGGRRHYDPEA